MTTVELSAPEKIQETIQTTPLRTSVERAVETYLNNLDGQPATDLYNMVLAEIEEPMLQIVMRYTKDNQSKAAQWLGLSRGTLRKLLEKYNML
jgi:Fis family transcriptional regulator